MWKGGFDLGGGVDGDKSDWKKRDVLVMMVWGEMGIGVVLIVW